MLFLARVVFFIVLSSLTVVSGAQDDSYGKFMRAYTQGQYDSAAVHGAKLISWINHPELAYRLSAAYAQSRQPGKAMAVLQDLSQRNLYYPVEKDSLLLPLKKEKGFLPLRARLQPKPVLQASTAFRLQDSLLIPENLAYHEGAFYAGSLAQRKIVKYYQGKETDFFRSDSVLFSVTGMKIDPKDNSLWICSFSEGGNRNGWSSICQVDLATGRLLRHLVKDNSDGEHLFNDLVITDSLVYFTDSKAGKVYRLRKSDMQLQALPARRFIYTNGIAIDERKLNLFIADYAGLYRLHLPTGQVTAVQDGGRTYLHSIDGLYYHKGMLLAVQNVEGNNRIVQFTINDKDSITQTKVLQFRDPDFREPTTGVVEGDTFYFIANSFVRSLQPDGTIRNGQLLQKPLIKRVNLNSKAVNKKRPFY